MGDSYSLLGWPWPARLPGILPPDAGRLERAARRYAIAALAEIPGEYSPLDAVEYIRRMHGLPAWEQVSAALDEMIDADLDDPFTALRLLRARVALYLRWCERVERSGCLWRANSDGWYACAFTDRLDPEEVANGWRWAVPLWTLAPAHDPAVTAAERRQRKENR